MTRNGEVAEARAGALLAGARLGDGEQAGAEQLIRRLANRHGCTRESCPDPRAHARDVAAMAPVLEAAGFVAYRPGGAP